jgi:hypothetical protein
LVYSFFIHYINIGKKDLIFIFNETPLARILSLKINLFQESHGNPENKELSLI